MWGTGGRENKGRRWEEVERDAGVMRGRETGEESKTFFNDFLVCF